MYAQQFSTGLWGLRRVRPNFGTLVTTTSVMERPEISWFISPPLYPGTNLISPNNNAMRISSQWNSMRISSQWIPLEYEELLAGANSVTFNGNSFLRDMNVDYMEISEDNEDFSLVMSDRLKTLETVLFDSSSSAGQTTCVICLDDFKERETIKKLPCHHYFHISCIDHWLKIKITCPLCRSDMTH